MIDDALIPAVVVDEPGGLLVIIGDTGMQQPAFGRRELGMYEILHFRMPELKADLPVRSLFEDQAPLL